MADVPTNAVNDLGPTAGDPAAGPVVDALVRNAVRRFAVETLSPSHAAAFIGVTTSRLYDLAAKLPGGWATALVANLAVKVNTPEAAAWLSDWLTEELLAWIDGPRMTFGAPDCLAVPRDPQWEEKSRDFIRRHPTCAACGTTKFLTVHHKYPVGWPRGKEREMREDNWIVLCESPTHNDHLWVGHLGDFRSMNPHVEEDAAAMLAKVTSRPYPK